MIFIKGKMYEIWSLTYDIYHVYTINNDMRYICSTSNLVHPLFIPDNNGINNPLSLSLETFLSMVCAHWNYYEIVWIYHNYYQIIKNQICEKFYIDRFKGLPYLEVHHNLDMWHGDIMSQTCPIYQIIQLHIRLKLFISH